MTATFVKDLSGTIRRGIVVGLTGGLAEIIWITFYGMLTGHDPVHVARSISVVIGAFPGMALISASATFGIAFHMIAAVALGIVLMFIWRLLWNRYPQAINEYSFMLAALTFVWLMNFFVVLPLIGPVFVHIVPYPISLISKLLFGLAAAATLSRQVHAGKRHLVEAI